MTQAQMAAKLGVKQSIVSKWESGREDMPRRRRHELLDLLTNRKDNLHPVLTRLCRRQDDVSVVTAKSRLYLKVASGNWAKFKLNEADALGTSTERWINPDLSLMHEYSYTRAQFSDDTLYLESEGDVLVRAVSGKQRPFRMLGKFYVVDFDGWDKVIVCRATILGPATCQPSRLHVHVPMESFDT